MLVPLELLKFSGNPLASSNFLVCTHTLLVVVSLTIAAVCCHSTVG